MVNPLNAGGIGRQYFNVIGRLRFFVEGGGPTKGEVTVRVHPDDAEEARKALHPSRLENALSTTGSALMVSSVFNSSFQGVCLSGLLGCRGFDFTKSDLIDRAFPITADRLLFLANIAHDKAVVKMAKSAAGSGKGDDDTDDGPGSAGGGSRGLGGGLDDGLGSGGGLDSSLVDLSDLFLG